MKGNLGASRIRIDKKTADQDSLEVARDLRRVERSVVADIRDSPAARRLFFNGVGGRAGGRRGCDLDLTRDARPEFTRDGTMSIGGGLSIEDLYGRP